MGLGCNRKKSFGRPVHDDHSQVGHHVAMMASALQAQSTRRGRVARVADESGAAASKPPPECSWPPPSPAKFRERRASRDGAATFDSAAMRRDMTMTFAGPNFNGCHDKYRYAVQTPPWAVCAVCKTDIRCAVFELICCAHCLSQASARA